MVVLAVTGYFIGLPLPTQPGEASANFLMGYIRFAHFAAAYIFAIGLAARIYWAFVGNHHAKQIFKLPITKASGGARSSSNCAGIFSSKRHPKNTLVTIRWRS